MSSVLLDRDAELATLSRRLASIRAGDGRVVVVEGPAGIGKSSLLAATARQAEAQGLATATARAGPLEQDAIWGVARQLFAPIRGGAGWAELSTGAASLAALALDPAMPEPSLAGDAMHAAVHGLVWLACNLAERRPTLLVVDDVHWADAASLRWLAALARRLDELPLGVLCTVRTGEPASDPDLLAELLAAAPEPTVRPRPLGPPAAEAIVAGRLPGADAAFAHACHAVTAGNPFLLGALLTHLVAEGIPPDAATANRLSTFGPEQIVRGVERQLARLPEGAGDLARALAVLGRGARLRHAAPLAHRSLAEAADLADVLTTAGLVHREDGLTLSHPLIAAALYRSLPSGVRGRLHAHAARLLGDEGAEPEEIALHLLHTEPHGEPQVVATLVAAAGSATARGAPESAAGFLRRALAEPPNRLVRADVTAELGLARAARWQLDATRLLSDAVDRAGTPAQRAGHALRGARALGLAGYFEQAMELSRRGLGDGVDLPDEQRERLEAELICNAGLQATTQAEMTRRQAETLTGSSLLGLSAVNDALQSMYAGEPAIQRSHLLGPLVAENALHREADSVLPTAAAVIMIADDDLGPALDWCADLIDLARPRGWLVGLAHASWIRSMALVRAGRIRSAEPDARLALEFKLGNTPPAALMWSLHTFVDVLTEADRLDEAEAVLARSGQLGDPPAYALPSPLLLQSRSRLRFAQHRPQEAYADARAAGDRWQELSVCHPALASWRVEAIAALVALGDSSRARDLAGEHIRLAERLGTAAPLAAGWRVLAQAGDVVDRVWLLERAQALTAASPAQLEHVRVLVDLGAALRRVNRRADARIPLQQALDLADRHGMALLARRSRAELVAAGARPRRPASTGPQALTPAEYRVASMAAAGHSNPEIAAQLFVTRRTVETHLTHVFGKLSIGSRSELGQALVVDVAEPAALQPSGRRA